LPEWAHIIGEDANRDSEFVIGFGGVEIVAGLCEAGTSQTGPDWNAGFCRCTDLSDFTASAHLTANPAGADALHGIVHSGAPTFDEFHFLPMIGLCNDLTSHYVRFDTFIDIRTQAMVDAACCIVASGTGIQITVVDAEGFVAILTIPVVDPM
jgi:hypothetical protein